jgi:hypothetical protein
MSVGFWIVRRARVLFSKHDHDLQAAKERNCWGDGGDTQTWMDLQTQKKEENSLDLANSKTDLENAAIGAVHHPARLRASEGDTPEATHVA